ncbi:MAG: DUF4292 domain-containing protein [Bacteroidetes bacterium]|nr:DUF4292 domain-containing protein [Bacteroidota bacterium]
MPKHLEKQILRINRIHLNINLRIKTDSLTWISKSPLLGIEVARVMITRDSVKFMDP